MIEIETSALSKSFGGLTAVNNLNLKVAKEEIVGLIGPNGAGKTTIFNLLAGFLKPTGGKIIFEGRDITSKTPYSRVKLGLARTFQLVRLFKDFTVMRNMVTASYLHPGLGFAEAIFYTPGYRRKEKQIAENSLQILRFLGLENIKNEVVRNLPHGTQKLVGIALAMATRPKLLLLDEPLAGMSPAEVSGTLNIIRELRKRGTTILLIEHNMAAVMNICDRIVVLNFGTEIASGSPDAVSQNKDVIQAYLGVSENAA
jgi:branched-chain amino acid transport system ATP-binding protein